MGRDPRRKRENGSNSGGCRRPFRLYEHCFRLSVSKSTMWVFLEEKWRVKLFRSNDWVPAKMVDGKLDIEKMNGCPKET